MESAILRALTNCGECIRDGLLEHLEDARMPLPVQSALLENIIALGLDLPTPDEAADLPAGVTEIVIDELTRQAAYNLAQRLPGMLGQNALPIAVENLLNRAFQRLDEDLVEIFRAAGIIAA